MVVFKNRSQHTHTGKICKKVNKLKLKINLLQIFKCSKKMERIDRFLSSLFV